MKTIIISCLFLLSAICPVFSEIISKNGNGFLEKRNDQLILHLKGTPYERGYQHGVLLREQIQHNIATYIDAPKSSNQGRVEEFVKNISTLISYVSANDLEEMKGLAEGSGSDMNKIIILNLFPEMFHCSGITVAGPATKNEDLYHVRILEYAIGKNLQNTAVLQIVEPDHGISYLNVSYAGFIGVITGMNQEKIAIGEIGGLGYGSWQGIPMAFLLKEIIQNATSLDDVKKTLQNSLRTCEYYYVFSDGKTCESIGVYATASQLHFISPGDSYALLAPSHLPENYAENGDNDKFILTSCSIENTAYQTLLFERDHRLALLFRLQLPKCLLLTGFPHPERYPVLAERTLDKYGKIDEKVLMEIIKRPVTRESNLHTAIFQPSQLKVWVAHAGPNNEPACDQSYNEWDLLDLLQDSSFLQSSKG